MKKGVLFVCDSSCQQVFEKIKQYLTYPPVLAVPVSWEPLLIYVRVMDHSLGALLAQNNDHGHEQTGSGQNTVTTRSRRNASPGFCHPEDVTLPSGPAHSRHILS